MTADTVGGVWTYCMDLCKALQTFDAEVHLVTMGDKMKDWQWQEATSLEHVTVYESDYKLEWMQNPWMDLQECGKWLLRLEEELQPDIIHLNCFAYGSLPFKAPVLVVAHSDVWSWFLSVKKEDPPGEWADYFRCVKNGLKGADKVIAPSGAMLDFLQRIYGIPGGELIYNGRDAVHFHACSKQPVVFSMGRIWDEAKNIRLLVDAAPFINAPVKIAGDNNFAQNSFETASSKVDYLGKLPTQEVAKQLSTAAVYVLPAKYEPFGLSALEAALSGCALVLGDIPSLKEIWKDAAVYVDTDDAEALAKAINALVDTKDALEKWGEKAKARAMKFSATAMAENYWKMYRHLVKQTKALSKHETA